IGAIILRQVAVDGGRDGRGEGRLLQLAGVARAGGEQDRLLDIVLVEDAAPDRDLFLGLELAGIAGGPLDLARQVRVPRLDPGPELRRPVAPAPVEIGPDLFLALENMAV